MAVKILEIYIVLECEEDCILPGAELKDSLTQHLALTGYVFNRGSFHRDRSFLCYKPRERETDIKILRERINKLAALTDERGE